jgi:PTH1 family peptidyl-tRNA hydrolase
MTRHNAGFMALDELCAQAAISLKKPWLRAYSLGEGFYGGRRIAAAKPLTFMNRSGEVLPRILLRLSFGAENLLVFCDTMDLPPGALRLKTKGSSAGHGGLKSVIGVLGTENFMRIYIGVGRPGAGSDVISHVLGTPEDGAAALIAQAAGRAARAALRLLEISPEGVMNEINTH